MTAVRVHFRRKARVPIVRPAYGVPPRLTAEPVHLSAMEFRLIRYLLRHPGIGLSRETILREVWGRHDTTTTRTVDVHVAALRQKLESDPARPELIVTVKGFGYMFTGEQCMN